MIFAWNAPFLDLDMTKRSCTVYTKYNYIHNSQWRCRCCFLYLFFFSFCDRIIFCKSDKVDLRHGRREENCWRTPTAWSGSIGFHPRRRRRTLHTRRLHRRYWSQRRSVCLTKCIQFIRKVSCLFSQHFFELIASVKRLYAMSDMTEYSTPVIRVFCLKGRLGTF